MHQNIDLRALFKRALASGYTTGALGRDLGLSQSSVSRIATGKVKPAKSMTVGLRLVSLVGGVVQLPPPLPVAGADAQAAPAAADLVVEPAQP